MGAKQLAEWIGRKVDLVTEHGQLRVAGTVKDARETFGRIDVLFAPSSGSGEAWISSARVETT